MSCPAQLPFPGCVVPLRRRSDRRPSLRAAHPSSDDAPLCRESRGCWRSNGRLPVTLVERYADGTAKRYVFHDELDVQTFPEGVNLADNYSKDSYFTVGMLSWLPEAVKEFILPAGFPESVSDDYLQYMLLQFPTNVTGWICHALVTSSLLKAFGVGSFSGSTAAASAAAIRWVSKDGIGAVGRLIIGGRFSSLFDDDPKQWRMYADFIGSAGSIFDLTTQLYPAYFLPLASLGNLTKAVARGLKDPSFRVIQNHFAVSGNLGEVAAKEEVWEVSAQLLGLALGILILDTPGLVKSFPPLAFTWMSMRLFHLWLRYQSLSVLMFDTINLKRACILVKSHVVNSKVSELEECNKNENILLWQRFIKPRIVLGASLVELLGHDRSSSQVKSLLKLYGKERYILTIRTDGKDWEILIAFKVNATSLSVLRAVWQASWLYENRESSDEVFGQLERSLSELENRFDDFLRQSHEVGWNIDQIKIKVPKGVTIDGA
ncbi:hypothetical protein MLD38_023908 [Melastoma candidum]|uniref:Uncharacterized protein n=1 Tax=Melastoma candidum TaxID=119954 RepID=A0ACB9NS75_9MYRT|nr:hypothetical protein MLD38_023908 [Melastoma candidum]